MRAEEIEGVGGVEAKRVREYSESGASEGASFPLPWLTRDAFYSIFSRSAVWTA